MTQQEALQLLYDVEDYCAEAQMWLNVSGVELAAGERPRVNAFFANLRALIAYVEGESDRALLARLGALPINAIWGLLPDDEDKPGGIDLTRWINTTRRLYEICHSKPGELLLPDELNTERAQKYFARAIEAGLMSITPDGLPRWEGKRGSVAMLGYFLERVYCPNNTEKLPEQALNRLFGVARIGSAITQLHNAKKLQKWRKEIDKLFTD